MLSLQHKTKDMSTLRFKYLHKVEGEKNQNKFYKMQENADGTFTVTYGREGAAKPATETYPLHRWETKLNEKLSSKKGYTDVTEHRTEATVPVQTKNSKGVPIISNDKHVNELITALQNYASAQTAQVYKAEAKGVTQKQIDDAQKYIDNLSFSMKNHFGKSEWSISKFNTELTKLYIIIPRKMIKVADHLITEKMSDTEILSLINEEQSNLDSMASQVITNTAANAADDTDKVQTTLMDTLGLTMELVTDASEMQLIKSKAQNHSHRVLRAFKVVNKVTQSAYDIQLRNAKDKKTDLLWHGSRNQNWWFIIQQGLKIRPSGAVHTGSMWDDGIYAACHSDKSMGYTDGGRWTSGGSTRKVIFMALFEFHLGKQLIKTSHDSSCYQISKECKNKGFDSVWAKAGAGIIRDEFIVYQPNQCTIKYLIEFSA